MKKRAGAADSAVFGALEHFDRDAAPADAHPFGLPFFAGFLDAESGDGRKLGLARLPRFSESPRGVRSGQLDPDWASA